MDDSRTEQVEFGFGGSGQGDGYLIIWMNQRQAEVKDKARRLGLPIGHMV
jgi:hypothetical protein